VADGTQHVAVQGEPTETDLRSQLIRQAVIAVADGAAIELVLEQVLERALA
jgi:hypothetical protein